MGSLTKQPRSFAYHYSLVVLRPDLAGQGDADAPLAIVVVEGTQIMFVATVPRGLDKLSAIGRAAVETLPATLTQQLAEVASSHRESDILYALAQRNRFNIFVTAPQEERSALPIREFAWSLFGSLVQPDPRAAITVLGVEGPQVNEVHSQLVQHV